MNIEANAPLSRYTSLHVGGPARYLVHAKTDQDVVAAVAYAKVNKLPYMPLGQGSNTIFSDAGFPGVIIHMEDRRLNQDGQTVTTASGIFMRQLVNFALQHNLRGLEELAGIPGTVGGAVRGNAGTWSTEIKDHLQSVDVLKAEESAVIHSLPLADCGFGYRQSIFKTQPTWIILRATFSLQSGDQGEGAAIVTKDLQQRHDRQPYDAPSAGSIFKNPDKEHGVFSGKLIESCGLKGFRIGGAEISQKHGNFILNRDHATASDILALIRHIQGVVLQEHNIKLEPEVHIVEQ